MSRQGGGSDESKGGDAEPVVRTLGPKDSPIVSVTVYTEAVAEVVRLVHLGAENPVGSVVEVVLKGFTKKLDKESVRVSGTGPAKILNVSCESVFYSAEQAQAPKEESVVEVLRQELEKCREQRNELQQVINRAARRQALIDKYSETAAAGSTTESKGKELLGLQEFKGLLDFYAGNAEETDKQRNKLNHDVLELDKKIASLEVEIYQRGLQRPGALGQGTDSETKTITVAVEVTGPGAIDLDLRYIVSGAQWSASYDVRISSADQSLVLQYYGLVQQNSGEDWVNVHLALSTATPSKGGLPPVLHTRTASVYQPPAYRYGSAMPQMKSESMKKARSSKAAFDRAEAMAAPSMAGGMMFALHDAEQDEEAVADVATTSVEGGGPAALGPSTFNIHKSSTVKSDMKPQKVTIGVVSLPSKFRHYVVPSKETSAYIQSKTVNASEYTLMPSKDCSIFFDNNFVARTELKLVQPGEEFQAFLGIDPSVKVEYLGPKTVTGSGGLFSNKRTKSYETTTVVTNQKAIPITVAIVESLPLSQNDKIKVSLVTPVLDSLQSVNSPEDVQVGATGSEASGDVTYLNKDTNNLVWVREVKPKAKATVPFRFTVEWPSGIELAMN